MKPGQLSGSDVSHIIEQEHSEAHYQKQQSVKMGRTRDGDKTFVKLSHKIKMCINKEI